MMSNKEMIGEDFRRALAGDGAALARLVATLTPIVQARVARSLYRFRQGAAAGRDVHQEMADMTQDVFLSLFAQDARVLRGWDAGRGLSLENYVGLVAERLTISTLRSGRRSPWTEDPTLAEDLDVEPAPQELPEQAAAARERIGLLRGRLQEELSPQGRWLFDLLFIRELTPPQVSAETGLSADAIYAWRSRLRKLTRRLLDEIG